MRKLTLVLLGVLCFSLQLLAQNRTITGKVTDDKGVPVPNASVTVKGSKLGTTANAEGEFTLTLPSSANTLVITSLNYDAREISIANTTSNAFAIVLSARTQTLNEVVVTALGIARDKRSLGYATQNLKTEDIADKGAVNVVSALQGKVSGVNITSTAGTPGASVNINIRGISSFQGSNQPLFVIDGVPVSNDVDRTNGGTLGTLGDNNPANRAADIDVNNIESVNILKGPAASVLYGSRAANGAIIITTKRGVGQRGKVNVTLNSSYSFQQAAGLLKLQNDYGQGLSGVFNPISSNSWGPKFGSTPSIANGLILTAPTTINGVTYTAGQSVPYQAYPNNIRDFYETGYIADNSLTINGGDINQNYTFTIGNVTQKGIVPNTSFNRTNVKAGFNTSFKDKWKLGTSVTFTQTLQNGVLQGNGSSVTGSLVNVPRSFDLQWYKVNGTYKNPDQTNNWFLSGADNPYFDAYENPLKSNLYRILGNITLGYDITNWLNVSYRLGADAYTDRRKQVFAISSAVRPAGQVLEDIFYRSELNGDLMINAKKNDLFLNGLNANLLLGNNINQRKFQNVTARGDNLLAPGFYNLSNATVFSNGTGEANTLRRLYGFYGQLSLAYNNYLFVELTGRNDVSSTLPKGNNSFFYPSASIGFVFTDALQLKNDILSYGKIRGSIAKVGNDAQPYLLDRVFVPGGYGNNVASITFPLSVNGNTVGGFGASTRLAPIVPLQPEFKTSKEIGINLGFFKNRASIDFAYFHDVSTNQIINVGIPISTGYSSYTTNVGKMTNQGVEALVNVTPVSGKNFTWDLSLNYTRIRNMVNEILPGVTSFAITGNAFTGTIPTIMVGQPYGVIVGTANPKTADGQYIINPSTGTYAAGVANQILADPNPNYNIGLNNNLRYKGFNLGFLFDYTAGGQIVSFTAGFAKSRGTWYKTAEDRDLPHIIPGVILDATGKAVPNNIQVSAQTYWQAQGLQSELNVYDATVVRLRELTLSYDLPRDLVNKIHLGGVRFGLFGRNLWYYAPNSPLDPETNTQGANNIRGLELQGFPNARSIGANLKISF